MRNKSIADKALAQRRGTTMLSASLILMAVGVPSIIEGFCLTLGSGLLFGQYSCFGSNCLPSYQSMQSMFWEGILLLALGVSTSIAACILFQRARKVATLFQNELHRRIVIVLPILILVLSVTFLGPLIPFDTTTRTQVSIMTIKGNACYQTIPSVTNPLFDYHGYESIGEALFHTGNSIYVECTVISGPQ